MFIEYIIKPQTYIGSFDTNHYGSHPLDFIHILAGGTPF